MSFKNLEFIPITSVINPSFWNKLSGIKLNDDKLDEIEHSVWGYFSNINNTCKLPVLEVNSTSFNSQFDSQKIYVPFHGQILNVNTIELFKDFDKTLCINRIGQDIINNIENGKALQTPSLLNRFYILSYADLKKFHFYYWFAFPVPYNLPLTNSNVKNIYDDFSKEQLEYIWVKYCDLEISQKPYFLVSLENSSVKVFELKEKIGLIDADNFTSFYFVFYDLSLLENCPGSMLRNYVTLILHHCPVLQGKCVNFLSFRIKRNEDHKLSISDSLIFNFDLPVCQSSVSDFINRDPDKRWVGWEKNERGKLGPRLSNMKSFLDPKELAESSVDLNLKLMKWRLLSNIDLDKIKATKFLLLGAGTLGCSVARILLGWGARNISFIDNSVVSYSNPVRQSLFTFEDSQNAKPKSVAAAENLRKIFPGVKSKSFQMTIPMPGHPVGESVLEDVKKDVELLTSLISDHDVIFLLMDSREGRWLPTLLGSYFSKIVINSALGFDSYLVMRHGIRVDTEEIKVRQYDSGLRSLKGNFLGCYFCNDVTAPGNSMKDRTLDQQCTVTRPGVSAIAGALAAEMAISILQHKEGAKAAAFYKLGNIENTEQELDNQCVLGIIPHSIRGFLSSFSQVLPAVERYQQCTACSVAVLDMYHKDGFSFLLKVFQDSKYLEDISGLANMNKQAEDAEIWEFSDEEEILCTDYEEENAADLQEKIIGETESNPEQSEAGIEISTESGVFEIKENSQHQSKKSIVSNVAEEKLFQRVIEDILENLIKKAEVMNEVNERPMKKNSTNCIYNTEFLNQILPDDILKIVENLQFSSSSRSLNPYEIEKNTATTTESLNLIQELQESIQKQSGLCNNFSGKKLSKYFLGISGSQEITQVDDKCASSSSSSFGSSEVLNDIIAKPAGLANGLLPVLKNQGYQRKVFKSNEANSSLGETKNFHGLNEIMKPNGVKFSLPKINDVIKSGKDLQDKKNYVNEKNTSLPNSRYASSERAGKEYSPSEFSAVKDKLFNKIENTPIKNIDDKSGTLSLVTLKSSILNFDSSSSSQNMSICSNNGKRRTSITGKIRRFFLFKKMSSDSFSAEDFLPKVEPKKEIITIAGPRDLYSSGSLTSQNLSMDGSVCFLAETDSNIK